jgi:L-lactate dehydrogenase complex protein LldG
MNRQEFLARVKQAARAGQAHRAQVRHDLQAATGYVGGGDDLCQRLADEVVCVGGSAQVVEGLSAARTALAETLSGLAAQSALCWKHPLLERLGLDALLAELNVAGWDHERLESLEAPERRTAMLAAGVGITSVAWAIAETGTLALAARSGRERVASLLPPVHLAIVAESQILPDLYDLFAALEPPIAARSVSEEVGCVQRSAGAPTAASANRAALPVGRTAAPTLPSNLVLITGPSKTGDIELELTTGVHGPGTIRVIVVRGE